MARKEKSTLDFIQLDCFDKTTFKRLNRKYGKEGRLFWIDLLRLLGRTDWYILDLSDKDILEDIMIDELDTDPKTGVEIINQLAKWGAICEKTWLKHKNIWCQNLIDRHVEVFNKRKKIPENPFTTAVSVTETAKTDTETRVSDTEMQQIKVKESKEKETIKNSTKNSAYEFLRKSDAYGVEVFEMQNKKSFPDFEKFIENFNQKVILEQLDFEPKILMARLRILNTNWDKKPKNHTSQENEQNKVRERLAAHD